MSIVDRVREQVRSECLAPHNRFGAAFFEEHLEPVVGYALRLAEPLGADREAVALAGWLHDLAAIRDLAAVPTHAADGARLARGILEAHGLRAAAIDAVCRAIATHANPSPPAASSPEERCLWDADVLAQLSRPAYWLYYLYGIRGLGRAEGLAWLRGRATGAWSSLHEEACRMGAAAREEVLRLVSPEPGALAP
jgi:hypothetical protein